MPIECKYKKRKKAGKMSKQGKRILRFTTAYGHLSLVLNRKAAKGTAISLWWVLKAATKHKLSLKYPDNPK